MRRNRGRHAGTPADQDESPAPSSETSMQRYHHAIITANWDLLAAMAWQGQRIAGRGFVLVSGVLPEPPEGTGMLLQPKYIPMPPETPPAPDDILPYLDHYDPDTEFIVCIEQTNGLRTVYTLTPQPGQLPPREAAQVVDLPL